MSWTLLCFSPNWDTLVHHLCQQELVLEESFSCDVDLVRYNYDTVSPFRTSLQYSNKAQYDSSFNGMNP